MIGKNVGIRRARGRYVLATNVDILFDDATVRYLRDRLRPGTMLRADRYDVPGDLAGQSTVRPGPGRMSRPLVPGQYPVRDARRRSPSPDRP